MYFNGPFVLINEKNNYEINIERININLDNDSIIYSGECCIDFILNSNTSEFDLNEMFNILKMFDSNGRMYSKKDIVSDFKLFEYSNNELILSLELKNGFIKEYNLDENHCEVCFDWYIISDSSKMFNKINHIQTIQKELSDERLEKMKNQPPIGTIEWMMDIPSRKPNHENDNESIWEHNTKHSFLPWNWFKNHKITEEETLDWH